MGSQEQHRGWGSKEETEKENQPYFVYFVLSHQPRIRPIGRRAGTAEGDPFLVLARDAVQAQTEAKRMARRKRVVEVRPVSREEFVERVCRLHEQGVDLPDKIRRFAGLPPRERLRGRKPQRGGGSPRRQEKRRHG